LVEEAAGSSAAYVICPRFTGLERHCTDHFSGHQRETIVHKHKYEYCHINDSKLGQDKKIDQALKEIHELP